MGGQEKVSRRGALQAGIAGVIGLAIGVAGGYLTRPPEIREVTKTLTTTVAAGDVMEVTKTVTQTITNTETVTKTVTAQPKMEPTTVKIFASPTAIVPMLVAENEGFAADEGLKIEASRVGYAEEAQLFIAGRAKVGSASPWEAADMVSEGLDIVFMTNAAAIRFFNSMFVRAEDADKYKSPKDLVGKPIGLPGWGSGTNQAFQVAAKVLWGLDVKKDFKPKIAEPAALLGLLERKEVEAALLFSGPTLAALGRPDKFKKIFSFADIWEKRFGHPLTINGILAYRDWLMANAEVAKRLEIALDRAAKWMMLNPGEFVDRDGKYVAAGEKAGWTKDDVTRETVKRWIKEGKYYISGYTQPWIDAQWEFIKSSVGILLDKLPDKDRVFRKPPFWPGI